MIGRCDSWVFVNSADGRSIEAAEPLGADAKGRLTLPQTAAEIGVTESELPRCAVGSIALRDKVEEYGYSRRRSQQLVKVLNGTIITVSPHGLPWARLEALRRALDAWRAKDGRRRPQS